MWLIVAEIFTLLLSQTRCSCGASSSIDRRVEKKVIPPTPRVFHIFILLLNLVNLPISSKGSYWHQVVMKESTVFIEACQARRTGSSCLKDWTLRWLSEKDFKGHIWCEGCKDYLLIGWSWDNGVMFQKF